MAGASIKVTSTGASEVEKVLNNILARVDDLTPVFGDIGEYLLEVHERRFADMQGPDGEAWEPLAPRTLKRKKRTDKILTEEGTLADTLAYQIGDNEISFGSNLEYAATHQFGREEDGIVARPFLGLMDFERDEVLEILQSYLIH